VSASDSSVDTADDASVEPRPIPALKIPLFPLLPARMRRQRRPALWQEIAFILLSYWVYSLVRDAVPTHETPAFQHAHSVLDLETSLHINIELTLNKIVDAARWGGWHWLANISDYYYAIMHFIIVIVVLIWVYVRHPMNYRSTRTALYAANGLAAIGFWFYPLAPPRLLTSPHFIDTVVKYHTWGSWGSGGVAKVSNQFAAMPSLHIGWSLWAGITLFMLSKRWWLRALGLLYPVATLFVILGTANHFVLDAVGGVVVLTLGFLIQRALTGRPAYAPPPEPSTSAVEKG
jgi:PAP2 superfamily